MRRRDQSLSVAVCVSLVLHGLLVRVALDTYVKEVGGRIYLPGHQSEQPGTPIFLAQLASQTSVDPPAPLAPSPPEPEEPSELDKPAPEPERPPLFGELTGTGTFIQSSEGDTPLQAEKSKTDQAFASRDPVGRALPGEAPAPNTAPTGEGGGGGGGATSQQPTLETPTELSRETPDVPRALSDTARDSQDVPEAERVPTDVTALAPPLPREVGPVAPERVTPPAPPPAPLARGEEIPDESGARPIGLEGDVALELSGPTTRSDQKTVLALSGDGPTTDVLRETINDARVDASATQPVVSASTRPVDPDWTTSADVKSSESPEKPTADHERLTESTTPSELASDRLKPFELASEYLKPLEPARSMTAPVTAPAVVAQTPGPGGAPGVAAPSADVAPQTDSEVDPFTKLGAVTFRPGKADVKFGRKIKTTRPRLLLAGQWASVTLKSRTVQVAIRINDTGKVTNVDVLRGSGTNDIDLPIQRAIYDWWIEPLKDKTGTIPTSDLVFMEISVIG